MSNERPKKAAIMLIRRTAIGVVLALLVALPATAQDFEKGAAAYKRGDYAAALREWRPLAEQGHANAQGSLGFMYDKGRGVPQDYAEAVKWYRKSAEQGFAHFQANLGYMYGTGRGVPQDYVLAYMWFSLAAAKGNKRAAKGRDILTIQMMTPAQIAEAQKLAREWWAKHPKKK